MNDKIKKKAQEFYDGLNIDQYKVKDRQTAEELAWMMSVTMAKMIYSLKRDDSPTGIDENEWNSFVPLLSKSTHILTDFEKKEFLTVANRIINEHDPDDPLSIEDNLLLTLQSMIRSHIYRYRSENNASLQG